MDAPHKALLDRVAEYAHEYDKRMPDFICTRITRRSQAGAGANERWKLLDTIEEEVTLVAHKETHKVLKVNGKPVKPGMRSLSGFSSDGEFGSDLTSIFDPDAHAEFQFERTEDSGTQPISVFRFRVNSHYTIGKDKKTAKVGGNGLLYALDSGIVERLHVDTDDPVGLSVGGMTVDVRFVEVNIAGQKYWLAGQAEARIRHNKVLLKREMEFRDYHKYAADASVSFETPK